MFLCQMVPTILNTNGLSGDFQCHPSGCSCRRSCFCCCCGIWSCVARGAYGVLGEVQFQTDDSTSTGACFQHQSWKASFICIKRTCQSFSWLNQFRAFRGLVSNGRLHFFPDRLGSGQSPLSSGVQMCARQKIFAGKGANDHFKPSSAESLVSIYSNLALVSMSCQEILCRL